MNIILVIPQSESVCYCLAMAEGNLARAGLTGKLCKMFHSTPSLTDSKSMSAQPMYATTSHPVYFSLHHSLSPSPPLSVRLATDLFPRRSTANAVDAAAAGLM